MMIFKQSSIHHSSLRIHHLSLPLCREAFAALARLFDCADHVEGLLGEVVVLAVDDLLEAAYGLGDGDVLALHARELLRDEEGLREEALHLSRARDDELVLFRKLIKAEDGDDVL